MRNFRVTKAAKLAAEIEAGETKAAFLFTKDSISPLITDIPGLMNTLKHGKGFVSWRFQDIESAKKHYQEMKATRILVNV